MRRILISGEKVGYVSYIAHVMADGKQSFWTGEFTFEGEKISVEPTRKAEDILPKVIHLVRTHRLRKRET